MEDLEKRVSRLESDMSDVETDQYQQGAVLKQISRDLRDLRKDHQTSFEQLSGYHARVEDRFDELFERVGNIEARLDQTATKDDITEVKSDIATTKAEILTAFQQLIALIQEQR